MLQIKSARTNAPRASAEPQMGAAVDVLLEAAPTQSPRAKEPARTSAQTWASATKTKKTRIVIVGGGAGGLQLAAADLQVPLQ